MTTARPRVGLGLPIAGSWATPEHIRQVATLAEDSGYECLWTFQRVLSPVDGSVDQSHASVLDSVVALSYAAACTRSIGLATGTLCAPFTAPAMLAKSLASLDVVSGGRLTVGLGMGWLESEYAAAGIAFERRGPRLEEYLECLYALWTQDPVAFSGEFYTVPPSRVAPRPFNGLTRPSYLAAQHRQRCAEPGEWQTDGLQPARMTSLDSPGMWRWCVRALGRLAETKVCSASSSASCPMSEPVPRAEIENPSRGAGRKCWPTSTPSTSTE